MADTLCTTAVSSFAGSAAVTGSIPSPPVSAANGSCSPVRRRRSDGSLPSHSNAPTVADPTNPPTASGGGDEHHPASPRLSYLLAGDVEDGRSATDICSKGVFDSLSDIQMKSDALRLHQRRGATRRRALTTVVPSDSSPCLSETDTVFRQQLVTAYSRVIRTDTWGATLALVSGPSLLAVRHTRRTPVAWSYRIVAHVAIGTHSGSVASTG